LSVVPADPLISPAELDDAAVTRPFASTVMDARVYVPAVTPLFASVAAIEPVPPPVTSPVRVIVWSPVFAPDVVPLTDAVPVTVSAPLPPFVRVMPLTLDGVMASRVRVSAGVAPPDDVPDIPLAVATETLVTVPVFAVNPEGLLAGYAPRFVRAVAALLAPVPPSATAKSVMPVMLPPVIATFAAD
jgi:hypothetical protein